MAETKGRNWWKWAFFVLLIVAEGLRETLVISMGDARPLVSKAVYTYGDLTVAQGRWVRADGGEDLVPHALTIECREDEGICYTASYQVSGNDVFRPELERDVAEFSNGVITIRDGGDCVSTTTRIDAETEEVSQTRVKLPDWRERFSDSPSLLESCEALEDRIVSRLSGYDDPSLESDPLKGHFVPIYRFIAWVAQ